MERAPVEHFAGLSSIPGITHAFTRRVPGLDLKVDRDLALDLLDEHHASARDSLGLHQRVFATATQVHGRDVAIVDRHSKFPIGSADGLITADPEVALGIYVADCCAIYLAHPTKRVIGLLHSGRKGSELGIATVAIEALEREFGCDPTDMIAQLSPCIRPPHYELDFSALIIEQLRAKGVGHVYDSGKCTASDPEAYYSYRREMGKTGRMLALLALS
jgi:copper oxidase (laccase) domain-containing protein